MNENSVSFFLYINSIIMIIKYNSVKKKRNTVNTYDEILNVYVKQQTK